MDAETLADTERKLGFAILKSHDDKRFRVRTLADVREIYERYFNNKVAGWISKFQIVLAVVVAAAQVITMCILRYATGLEALGMGNWASIITLFAAASVIWTCRNTTYLRLHLSLALHVVSMLASIFFLLLAFEDSIPQLRRRLYSSYLTPRSNDIKSYSSVYQLDSEYATTARPIRYYSAEHGPVSIIALSLSLTAIMTVATMVQMILSIIMVVMTSRAMCIGRIKMEGKLLAMEIAGREDKDTFVMVPWSVRQTDPSQRVVPPPPPVPSPASQPPPSYNKVLLGHSDADSVA